MKSFRTLSMILKVRNGKRSRGSSPYAATAPSIVLALGYLLALLVWLALGDVLPGGRRLAIHLFTLGVLTNLVLTFSEHFARTVTSKAGERPAWWPVVTNVGVLLVLVGLVARQCLLLVAGATIVTVSVLLAYHRIRAMRRAAIGGRFAWVARVYERAHRAFIYGAVLGAMLGNGVFAGNWYVPALIAHLHANILGWGGLTLLATLGFFGPSMGGHDSSPEPTSDRPRCSAMVPPVSALRCSPCCSQDSLAQLV